MNAKHSHLKQRRRQREEKSRAQHVDEQLVDFAALASIDAVALTKAAGFLCRRRWQRRKRGAMNKITKSCLLGEGRNGRCHVPTVKSISCCLHRVQNSNGTGAVKRMAKEQTVNNGRSFFGLCFLFFCCVFLFHRRQECTVLKI